MATIKYGSSGDEVTKLQKKLNTLGYNLDEDGKYGKNTEAAVKDYQSKMRLGVDGIVGAQTSGSLYGSTGPSEAVTLGVGPGGNANSAKYSSAFKSGNIPPSNYPDFDYDPFEYADFTTSADTDAYKQKLGEVENNKPGEYQSQYTGQINAILDSILNREKFDINTDQNYKQLYDNYRELYLNQANKAMRDTMGAAQGATGGYGSSYAQAVGQQAYDDYISQLNDRNIDLYNLAYGMYRDDMNDRYNQLGAVEGLDQTDYGRYRDSYNDWLTDRDYYANRYDTSYGNDFNKYQYQTNLDYNNYVDSRALDYQNYADQRDYAYRLAQDALAQENYENEFAYQREQDAMKMALAAAKVGSDSGVHSDYFYNLIDFADSLSKNNTEKFSASEDYSLSSAIANAVNNNLITPEEEKLLKKFFSTKKKSEGDDTKYNGRS